MEPVTALTVAAAATSPVTGLTSWLMASHLWSALYHRHTGRELPRASVGEHVQYYATEVASCLELASFYVRGAFQNSLWEPERRTGPPVLCVHGFTQNGTNFLRMRRRLHAAGRPSLAVNLGVPFQRLERYVEPVARALRAQDEPVDVVAHSMGGVVLRLALATHRDLGERVRRVVTLGSPHRGTGASRGVRLIPDAKALHRRSELIRGLPTFAELTPARVTTVAAERDLIVYPVETCHLPEAEQVTLPGVGHVGLVTRRSALDVIDTAVSS